MFLNNCNFLHYPRVFSGAPFVMCFVMCFVLCVCYVFGNGEGPRNFGSPVMRFLCKSYVLFCVFLFRTDSRQNVFVMCF